MSGYQEAPPASSSGGRISRAFYLGVLALLAVSFMLFQIALLRELRYQLTTLFTLTPFLFSTIILCIALGSLLADRVSSSSIRVLHWGAAVLPIAMIGAFAMTLLVAQALVGEGSGRFVLSGEVASSGAADAYLGSTLVAFVAVAAAGYGVVFVLQGLIFALYFREGREHGILSEVYGVELLASATGALLGGALNFVVTPVQMVLLAAALMLVTLDVSFRWLGIRPVRVAVVSVLTLGLIAAELVGGLLTRLEGPHRGLGSTFSLWSRYRRIDVSEAPPAMTVYADGLLFQGNNQTDASPAGDPRRFTTELIERAARPVRDVLIVGAGTGTDVRILRSVVGDRLNIVAVELDSGFVETARAFPWLWQSYRTAEIVVQEGRYFLENTSKEFDLVLYAYIDPQSAVGSIGIPDANFLYTDAGLRSAFARLRPGGYLVMNRVYLAQEEDAFIHRTCATLRSAGIGREQTRLYRRRGIAPWGYYGVLKSFHLVASKGDAPPALEDADLIPLPWVEQGRPTTDLFPFSLGTGMWFDSLLKYVRRNVPLLIVGMVSLAAVVGAAATSLGRFTFFTLGFGFFLVESLVLFNSFLLFGDPNLSAALAIGVFLLWNGVGSVCSSRFERSRGFLVAVPAAILLYGLTAPALSMQTISAPPWIRLALFAAHVSLGGVACGMMFPVALRRFREESVPKMFFIDVVGCALAPPLFWLTMSFVGLWLVILGAGLSYASVCLVLGLRR